MGYFITVSEVDAFFLGGQGHLPSPATINGMVPTQHSPTPDRTTDPFTVTLGKDALSVTLRDSGVGAAQRQTSQLTSLLEKHTLVCVVIVACSLR